MIRVQARASLVKSIMVASVKKLGVEGDATLPRGQVAGHWLTRSVSWYKLIIIRSTTLLVILKFC